MTYTSQGLMTMSDLDDYRRLTDTGPHPDCPGHEYDDFDEWGHTSATTYCSVNEDCPADED